MVLPGCMATEVPVACFSCRGVLWPVERGKLSTSSTIMRHTTNKQQPVLRCYRATMRKQVVYATAAGAAIFEPFKEIEEEAELRLLHQDEKPDHSLARLHFADSSESAMNDQINVLYNLSYIYHSLFAYFDRDDVALPGFARYFKEESDHRRQRAEELKEYQNVRGGRVHLSPLLPDEVLDFDQVRKTMKLVTGLEKLSTEKFYGIHKVAEEAQDKHLVHLIKSRYLAEQIEIVKRLAEYVAQLSLIGDEDGHGIYYFDRVFGTEGN